MGTLQFKNNASTTLSGSINNSQTAITVINSSGFPSLAAGDYFYATMYEISGTTEINIEIIKVTGTVGNNWTIVRGQDGTTGRSRDGVVTCYIELRWTAASSQLMLQKDLNLSDLSSASTSRTNLGLGTIATQDASNVSITGGTISNVTITTIDSTTTIADNGDTTKKLAFEVSGVATGTTRTLTVPNASGTIALTSDLSAGYQPLDSDLTAIAGLSVNGLIARTATGTAAARSITQPAAGITVTNGDGVAGNPTIGLANDLGAVEAINTTGFVRRTAADTWSASALVDADIPGALTGKTYNGLTPTSLATGFSIAGGTTSKTLTVSNSITLAGTDSTTITLPSTSGTIPLNNQTFYIGTTAVQINRASASLSLTGVSIDGAAGSAASATSATTSTNLASGVLGSLPYQSAAATTALLSPNTTTTRNFLRMTGTGSAGAAPAWDTVTKTDVGLSNVENTALSTWTGSTSITTLGTVATGTWNATAIGISKGGTGATTAVAAFDALAPTTTLGDVIYHDGTDNVRLAGNTTTNRRFLRQTGTGTVSAAPAWDGLLDADIPSALTGKTYNALTLTAAATGFTIAGGTTSKTLTVNNTLALSGTDSSTLNIGAGGTLGSAAFTASTAYAPAAGSTSIVTLGTITAGTWTGSAIGISYGGTGATSKAAGFNALSPVTTLGDLIYGDGANSNTRLAGNTTTSKRFLTQTGTGSASAAPGWNAIVDGDLPSALTGKTYNGLTLTANATGFSVAGGTTSKTLQVNNNLTLSGTDGSTLNIGGGGTLGTGAYATIANYATLDSPTFTGTPAAPTAAVDTNTTQLATTAYVVGQGYLKSATASSTYLPLAGGTLTGGLTFSGIGRRIIADFSSTGNFADQLAFQTSTTDGSTTVNIIPNGTGISSSLYVWGNQSMANTALGALSVANGSSVTLASSKLGTGTALPIVFSIEGNERLRIATSGNVGIGVVPSAWGASNKALQILNATLFSGGGVNDLYLSANAYYSTSWKYLNTAAASYYSQLLGAHAWYTAPSGTAGNTITFTQAMTLNASGNLGLGVTPSAWDSTTYNAIELNAGALAAYNSTGTTLDLVQNAYFGVGAYTYKTTGAATIYRQQSGKHFWGVASSGTAGASASFSYPMALDNSGNLGIGTTSPGAKLDVNGNVAITGASRRITGDFSNADTAQRPLFQSSTTNGQTFVGAIPNGTATGAFLGAYNNSSPTNSGFVYIGISNTRAFLDSSRAGTGTSLPLDIQTDGTLRMSFGVAGGLNMNTGLREARVAMGANTIDVIAGNYFTKTISGATTLTVSNVPSAGTAVSFILDLTNGGSATITWWSGVRWAAGVAPTLTASGRDVLSFFTHDGGTNWTGLMVGRDVK